MKIKLLFPFLIPVLFVLFSAPSIQAQSYFTKNNWETQLGPFSTINGQWITSNPTNNTLGTSSYQGINFGYDINNYSSLVNPIGTDDLYFGRWDYDWKGWRKIVIANINGNVGIGTTTPTEKLHVLGNIVAGNANGQEGSLFLGNSSHGIKRSANNVEMYTHGADGNLLFSTFFNQEKMRIQQNGYVGIGTQNPIGKFDVRGNVFIGTTDLSIGSVGSFVQIDQGSSTGNSYSQIRAYSNGGNINNNLILQSTGGNVGIGTTLPAYKLDVNGQVSLGGTITNHWVFGINAIGSGGSGVWFDYNNAVSNTALIQAETQGTAYRNIGINPYGGNVGIGTTTPDEKLTVKGKIHAQEVRVDLQGACAPDYVFQKYYTGKSNLKSDYVMPTLAEIESFTKKNNHLPNVPSAQEVQQNGVSLGTMSNVLLQKVEELTLYAIEQQKKLEVQNKTIEMQSKILEALTTRLDSLEKK